MRSKWDGKVFFFPFFEGEAAFFSSSSISKYYRHQHHHKPLIVDITLKIHRTLPLDCKRLHAPHLYSHANYFGLFFMHNQAFTSFLRNWNITCKCPSLFFQVNTFSIVVHPDKRKPYQKMLRRWNENDKDDAMFQLFTVVVGRYCRKHFYSIYSPITHVTEPYHVLFLYFLFWKSHKNEILVKWWWWHSTFWKDI